MPVEEHPPGEEAVVADVAPGAAPALAREGALEGRVAEDLGTAEDGGAREAPVRGAVGGVEGLHGVVAHAALLDGYGLAGGYDQGVLSAFGDVVPVGGGIGWLVSWLVVCSEGDGWVAWMGCGRGWVGEVELEESYNTGPATKPTSSSWNGARR